jgi:hypothetical protein
MEVHKILLEKVEVEVPEEYRPFVKPELPESISGEITKLKITIKNVGEETFPSGYVERWEINEYGAAISPYSLTAKPRKEEIACMKIPKLAPGEVHQIEYSFIPTIAGIAEVCIKITSEDKKPIYHIRRLEETGGDEWKFLIHVIDRVALKTLVILSHLARGFGGREMAKKDPPASYTIPIAEPITERPSIFMAPSVLAERLEKLEAEVGRMKKENQEFRAAVEEREKSRIELEKIKDARWKERIAFISIICSLIVALIMHLLR